MWFCCLFKITLDHFSSIFVGFLPILRRLAGDGFPEFTGHPDPESGRISKKNPFIEDRFFLVPLPEPRAHFPKWPMYPAHNKIEKILNIKFPNKTCSKPRRNLANKLHGNFPRSTQKSSHNQAHTDSKLTQKSTPDQPKTNPKPPPDQPHTAPVFFFVFPILCNCNRRNYTIYVNDLYGL